MKKVIFLLMFLFQVYYSAHAQINILFGVKAGIYLSYTTGSAWDYHLGMNIQEESIYGDGMSSGIIAGGFAVISLSDKFAVRAEANLLTKTFKTTYYLKRNNVGSYSYFEDEATIYEIPILIQYSPFPRFTFATGPSINFLSSDEDDIAANNFCMIAELQFRISKNISVEGQYNWDLTNLYEVEGIGMLDLTPVIKSFGPQFTVSYSF